MKKALSVIAIAICAICSMMVYLNMSTGGDIANEISISYAEVALNSIGVKTVQSSFANPDVSGQYGNGSGISLGGNMAGMGTGTSQFADYDVYTYDEDLYKAFASGPLHDWILKNANKAVNDNGAKALSAILTYFVSKPDYGFNFGIGVIANVLQESSGTPGFWQNTIDRVHRTWADVEEMMTYAHPKNAMGFGILQWTYYTYLPQYRDYLQKYCQNGVFSDDDIRAADLHYAFETYLPPALSAMRTDTAYNAAYTLCYNHIRPGNKGLRAAERANIAEGLAKELQAYNK